MALKEAQGPFVTSMFGYTLGYNSLDNNRNPTGGFFAELRQDIAGAGGDERFVRTTGDLRYYHEIYDQIVGLVHLQGGDLQNFGGSQFRIVDNFNLGPTLVRGFAPFGIGPRDVGSGDPQGNPLGGTKYFGGSLEVQFPLYGLPRDLGLKGAIFADAGTLFGFNGRTNFSPNGVCTPSDVSPLFTQSNCITVGGNSSLIRTSAGASIIWSSPLGTNPLRLRQGHHQEPIRSDSVLPLHRRHHLLRMRPAGPIFAALPAVGTAAAARKSHGRSFRLWRRGEARMSEPVFFPRAAQTSLADIVACTGAAVLDGADLSAIVSGVAPLDEAEPGELTFLDSPENARLLETSRATACFVTSGDAPRVPKSTMALVMDAPARGFALALRRLFPQAIRPNSLVGTAGINPGASIHPEARLEQDVIVDPGVVIGPCAEIGSGSIVGANSVIGSNVRIGRDCRIGPQATISHALIGDRVILHPGVRIGQPSVDFGHAGALALHGLSWTPWIGRVIIQDGVEIGANSTIDRGVVGDTVIGEETRIGNLARIAGNVTIGRCCTILAQLEIPAGAQLEDSFVAPRAFGGLAMQRHTGRGGAANGDAMERQPHRT